MKYNTLVILILLLAVSCGSSTTTTDDAAAGGILSTDSEETDVVSIMSNDSLLLASFVELGHQINNIDSLLLVIQSGDSLMRDSILNLILGDTLNNSIFDSEGQEEVVKEDSTITNQTEKNTTIESTKIDPHAFAKSSTKPPCGRVKLFKYQSFGSAQPNSYSVEKSFPRYLRGTYYNTVNRNFELVVTKHALLYGETKLDTIFKITDTTTVKIEQNTLLLNYLQKGAKIENPYWVTDQMTLNKDTLFFKTIPPGTLSEYPSKKQIREYLKTNNTQVITSYYKLK